MKLLALALAVIVTAAIMLVQVERDNDRLIKEVKEMAEEIAALEQQTTGHDAH